MAVKKAVLIGVLWVAGSAMLGFLTPLVVAAVVLSEGWLGTVDRQERVAGPMIAVLSASAFVAWLVWSTMATRWRLWAYRAVDDIETLKAAAVSASFLFPDGHPLQRTELRTRRQAEELARLEARMD